MDPNVETALILLGGPTEGHHPGARGAHCPPRELRDVAQDLIRASKAGARLAVLAGGELTSRPDLPRLLRLARKLGLWPGLATHGRRLADRELRQLLYTFNVSYLRVPLLGATAEVHNALAGVERAFERTTAGLRALVAEAPETLVVDVAVTVTAGNLDQLGALAELVASWPRRCPVVLRLVAPLTALPPARWPPADAVSHEVSDALSRALDVGLRPAWEGFPPCLLEDKAHLRDEVLRYGAPAFGPLEAAGSIPREVEGDRASPPPCQECLHLETCPGAPAAFLELDGEGALRPSRALRANSFNFERQGLEVGGWKPGDGPFVVRRGSCSASRLRLEGTPVRWVIFRDEDEETSLCHTPTSDFTDRQIAEIKDRLEQVYHDRRTDGATLDDFLESVQRLRLHSECHGCPDRPRCPTTFVTDPEPPFQREERWLRKEVSRMRGRVLDVGCGEGLYREEIDRLIAAGEIEYHGLDPDGDALEKLRRSGSAGALHQGEIETFDWEEKYFDYVLLLRSFNHLRDLDRAFTNISRVMRPRGQLVLCDSPPFALLRTAEQVAYADQHAPQGYQHYRNWTSHQVLELLSRFPFRVDIHRPVSAKTSNEWILKLMREDL